MIKEYVQGLLQENDDQLEQLQRRMNSLLEESGKVNETLENMQRERNRDENIFSPRAVKNMSMADLDKTKTELERIKQEIEFVREKTEACVQKKHEYEALLAEVETEAESETPTQGIAEKLGSAVSKSIERMNQECAAANEENGSYIEKELYKEETDNASEENAEEKENQEKKTDSTVKTILLLKELYKSTEISLAFLNGNRNKCKTELQKMKNSIKTYLTELENEEF